MVELAITLGISMVVAAIAVPMMSGSIIGSFRLSGDVHSLANTVYLTKLRSAADFTKSRLYVDYSVNSFHIETWTTGSPGSWTTEGGLKYLSDVSESYGYGVVGAPPGNTQGTIGQAPQCLDATGAAIGNTSCIVFNSRGIPVVDKAASTGDPTNADALYLTDGQSVFGVTVTATGIIQVWRTNPVATPTWVLQ